MAEMFRWSEAEACLAWFLTTVWQEGGTLCQYNNAIACVGLGCHWPRSVGPWEIEEQAPIQQNSS